MKIIARKSNLYNTEEFLAQINPNDYIYGIFIDIASTNDNKLVLFQTVNNNLADLMNIEQMDLNEIESYNPITIQDFLDLYLKQNNKKKIFINMVISSGFISFEKIKNYCDNLLQILQSYPQLTFYLCSVHQGILNYLKQKISLHYIGAIISEGISNYIDVGFYIFTPNMLNNEVLLQQAKMQKGLMVILASWDSLNYVNNFFSNSVKNNILSQDLIDQICLIGSYPNIINKTIN